MTDKTMANIYLQIMIKIKKHQFQDSSGKIVMPWDRSHYDFGHYGGPSAEELFDEINNEDLKDDLHSG
jgi:hypothetical protein